MTPQKILLFSYAVTVVCAVFGILLSFLICWGVRLARCTDAALFEI